MNLVCLEDEEWSSVPETHEDKAGEIRSWWSHGEGSYISELGYNLKATFKEKLEVRE